MKKFLSLLVIATICIGVTGCNNTKKNPIVGKWAYSSSFVYTFNEDKTCEYNVSGTIMKCTYEIEDNKLSILYNGDTIPFDTTYSIKDDKLTIKDSMGTDVVYKKQKD